MNAEGQSLRIAQVVSLWASVPPTTYGGIQLRTYWLIEELIRRGHRVTLFGSGDSRTPATLRSACERNLTDLMAERKAWQYGCYANSNFAEALRNSDQFDIIHCHMGCEYIPLSVLSAVPVVHTMATVLGVDEHWVLTQYPDVPAVAISRQQISDVPAERRKHIPVVYHGCDFESYTFGAAAGAYLAFLGRMAPRKSPVDAIEIAKHASMPLVLAGKPQNNEEQRYFAEQVRPRIDGRSVVHVGPVNHSQKNELLSNAAALLFPIQWEEPFGLVMIEAMACGTPVVAYNRGSVAEVIDVGETGFYGRSIDELVACVPKAVSLDRYRVREQARRRFSRERMTDDYLALYRARISA